MKRFFTKIHLWLSIPFGIIITIMCITGGLLIFETEILQITNPQRYYVEKIKENQLPLERLIPVVKNQLPDTIVISSITVPCEANRNYSFAIEGLAHGAVMADPYTGKIREIVLSSDEGFFSTVRRLHRWFLFETKRGEFSFGKLITGTSTLVFFFILLTGIIIWIPKTLKSLKNRLSIHLNKGLFRFWYDLHIAGGIYVAVFLIAFCLTGLTWSFGWYRTGFYKMFGVENIQNSGHGNHSIQKSTNERNEAPRRKKSEFQLHADASQNQTGSPVNKKNDININERIDEQRDKHGSNDNRLTKEYHDNDENNNRATMNEDEGRVERVANYSSYYIICDKLLTDLKRKNPGFRNITIQDSVVMVSNKNNRNTRAFDKYSFNSSTGEITGITYYDQTSDKASTLRGWIYLIHVGSWGGITTRILSLIACLIGASLPLTGYYFYLKKKFKQRAK